MGNICTSDSPEKYCKCPSVVPVWVRIIAPQPCLRQKADCPWYLVPRACRHAPQLSMAPHPAVDRSASGMDSGRYGTHGVVLAFDWLRTKAETAITSESICEGRRRRGECTHLPEHQNGRSPRERVQLVSPDFEAWLRVLLEHFACVETGRNNVPCGDRWLVH